MKNCILLAFLFLSLTFNAQEKIYFTKDFKEVKSAELATYYSTYEDIEGGTQRTTYNIDGTLKNSAQFSNMKRNIRNGTAKSWYKSGSIETVSFYVKNKLQGLQTRYYENGQIKRTENFDKNEFVDGKCFDENGSEITFFPYYEKPEFPGGTKKFYKYIAQSFKMPNGAKGTIKVKFVVQADGKLREFEILEGLNYDMNVEVLRILHSSPPWTPGKIDGEIADISYSIPITIK